MTSILQRLPILMYHSISEVAAPAFQPFVSHPSVFRSHLQRLRALGYSPVTMSEIAAARLERRPLPDKPVALTFDDGFADFYTHALPPILENGFTATVFISTAYVGGKSTWLEREGEAGRAMLTWEQIREMSAVGIECAAHAHHHLPLDGVPYALARQEITRSKGLIESRLGLEVTSFAYPFGYYTKHTAEIVRDSGFSSACIVGGAVSTGLDELSSLPRLWVTSETDANELERLLSGPTLADRSWIRRTATQARWILRRNRTRLQYKRALARGATAGTLERY